MTKENLERELRRIEAKRTLEMKLTDRERALWTLYGENKKIVKGEKVNV